MIRWKRGSLKRELALGFMISVALLLALFGCTVYVMSADDRREIYVERLRNKAKLTAQLLIEEDEIDIRMLHIIDRNNLTSLFGEQVTISTLEHQVLYDSDEKPDEHTLEADERQRALAGEEVYFQRGEREGLAFISTFRGEQYLLVVSAIDRSGLRHLKLLGTVIASTYLAALVLIGLVGWLFAGQVSRPLKQLAERMSRITAQNLSQRLPEEGQPRELRTLAQQFNSMLDRLERAFGLQRQFVGNASHELRTPLTSIRGQIDVALLRERTPEDYRQTLESLREDIGDLTELTGSLLDLNEASQDSANILLTPTDLAQVLLEAYESLGQHRPQYRIELEMPPVEEAYQCLGHAPLLRSAVRNLLDNGAKFSPNQTVHARMSRTDNELTITIRDNGPGITPAEQERLFEPFFRGRNGQLASGHGIGLPVVARITTLHRGRIEVDSVPGQGSTFRLVVPAC